MSKASQISKIILGTKHRCQPSTDTTSSRAMPVPKAVEAGGHVRGKTETLRKGLPHLEKHIKMPRGLRGINARNPRPTDVTRIIV